MSIVVEVFRQIIGMFIGDAGLALAIFCVVALAAVAVLALGLPSIVGGAILLGGCLLVLILGIRRAARSSNR